MSASLSRAERACDLPSTSLNASIALHINGSSTYNPIQFNSIQYNSIQFEKKEEENNEKWRGGREGGKKEERANLEFEGLHQQSHILEHHNCCIELYLY